MSSWVGDILGRSSDEVLQLPACSNSRLQISFTNSRGKTYYDRNEACKRKSEHHNHYRERTLGKIRSSMHAQITTLELA
jgi:hypothetical protein